jgi:hypothetical protein
MAFSVKMVKSILSSHNMPVDDLDAAAEEICARHSADFDSIKEERDNLRTERDNLKKDTETLASVQKELDELKGNPDDNYKAKYEQEKKDFADYKAQVAGEKALEAKKTVLREIAKDAGLSENGIAKALKYHDYSKMELDEKGAAKEKAAILKGLKEEWADYIQTTQTKGANIATPPANNGGGRKTVYEIMAIEDDSARQTAIAQNLDLFGVSV